MIQSKLFEIGNCYKMYFQIFNSTIQFNVMDNLNNGYHQAKICSTDQEFLFSISSLMKEDINKLKKVKCGGCKKTA